MVSSVEVAEMTAGQFALAGIEITADPVVLGGVAEITTD